MRGLEIVRLRADDLEDAAALVTSQYRKELEGVPILPKKNFESAVILPKLETLSDMAPGIAARKNGELAGFIIGIRISAFKGYHDGVYCPEWANAAIGSDRFEVYRRMYEGISPIWAKNGCFTHAVTVFAHDRDAVNAWFWNGFGLGPVDAVRTLDRIPSGLPEGLTARRLDIDDADDLRRISLELSKYMASEPLFHPLLDTETKEYFEKWLYNRDNCVWAAFDGKEIVSYIKCVPSYDGASYTIRDPGTFSVNGAYTLSRYRGKGIQTTLLDLAVGYAGKEGFERCSVDFESYNINGSNFWTGHFTPCCYSLVRKIDERSAWAGSSRDIDNIW